jgi:hypothetical protein
MIGQVFIVAALALVAVILFAGITIMVIGGRAAGEWSNILMRYRVMAQGLALIAIVVVAGIASMQ